MKSDIPFLDLGRGMRELRTEIDGAIGRVLDSGRYILGQEVEDFERQFAQYCGADCCVGAGNGLDALTLLLRGLGLGPGDEVIVAANTFIATWLAVTAAGARVVPVEPDLETWNIDPQRVEEAVTSRTRAILATYLYGRPADMEALQAIADRRGLYLLSDAAQAHGIKLRGYASAFSFYPNKNLGALGDGGAVITDDKELARRIRTLGNYGSEQKYVHGQKGVNSRLDPLQAAVLRVKLGHLDEWNMRRQKLAGRYCAGLELRCGPELSIRGRSLPEDRVWHIFAIYHERRDELACALRDQGVGTLIHYPEPPHLSGAYGDLGFKRGAFPKTEQLARTELSLPFHPHLTETEADRVMAAVLQFMEAQSNSSELRAASAGHSNSKCFFPNR